MSQLDPTVEFADLPDPNDAALDTPAPTPDPPAPPAASAAEVAALKGEMAAKLREIDTLKSKTAIVDKLHEVFAGKSEDPKDAYIKKEIRRLVPELDDLDKIRQLLPAVVATLGAAAQERMAERADLANEIMTSRMAEVGLDAKDADAAGYMEEALTREIRSNKELLALWERGNVKKAVNAAFDKVQSKLFAPGRVRAKRSAVNTITESPKASPRGNAPSAPIAPKAVDARDSSRDGVKKVHDAAFDRLQELLGD